jgi:hypothetical protein
MDYDTEQDDTGWDFNGRTPLVDGARVCGQVWALGNKCCRKSSNSRGCGLIETTDHMTRLMTA